MIKGCHKRIVFLKDTGNELFEEAYFVLKPYAFTKIVNGITNNSIKIKERKRGKGRLIFFLLGTGLTSAIFIILNSTVF